MSRYGEREYYYEDTDEIEHSVLLPHEVMNYLACGRSTFYQLVQSGELKAFRVGKQWRVTKEELERFTHQK